MSLFQQFWNLGGASSLYFLNKGFNVVMIEHDVKWRERVCAVARAGGFSINEEQISTLREEPNLIVVEGKGFSAIPYEIAVLNYFIVVIDREDRRCNARDAFTRFKNSIIVIDNYEFARDWGNLPISSGYPERAGEWRGFLHDNDWRYYLFEQPEGRSGHATQDFSGYEAKTPKITGVFWPKSSSFGRCCPTVAGFPLLSPPSIDNSDLPSLRERCPYPSSAPVFEGRGLGRKFR